MAENKKIAKLFFFSLKENLPINSPEDFKVCALPYTPDVVPVVFRDSYLSVGCRGPLYTHNL